MITTRLDCSVYYTEMCNWAIVRTITFMQNQLDVLKISHEKCVWCSGLKIIKIFIYSLAVIFCPVIVEDVSSMCDE